MTAPDMPGDDRFESPGEYEQTTPLVDTVLDASRIFAPLAPLTFLVDELRLVRGGGAPHMFAGYGFSGKTVTLQALSVALAADRPVWGSYRGQRGARVLHVDLEQGERLDRERYQRIARSMGVQAGELQGRLSLLACPPDLQLVPDHLDAWCQLATGFDLMWVDSVRAGTRGQDENSSAFRSGLDLLRAVASKTGCECAAVHHGGKPDKDGKRSGKYSIRGSSAIFDALDCAYVMSAAEDEPVQVLQEKARTVGGKVEPFCLVIADEVEPANGTHQPDPRWGLTVKVLGQEAATERRARAQAAAESDLARRKADEIVALLLKHPAGVSQEDVRKATTLTNGSRWLAVKLALGDRVTFVTGVGGRGNKVTLYHPSHATAPDRV